MGEGLTSWLPYMSASSCSSPLNLVLTAGARCISDTGFSDEVTRLCASTCGGGDLHNQVSK